MIKLVKMLSTTLAVLGFFSTVSFAADNFSCKKDFSVTGNGAITEEGAKKKATTAWKNAVIAEYGIFFGDEKNANEGLGLTVERCARSTIGLMICQAHGKACAVVAGNEKECTREDSKNCDPKIKWIQAQLSSKGYDVGVDGSAGRQTERAIEKYKRDNKISDDATIDAVIESLKK